MTSVAESRVIFVDVLGRKGEQRVGQAGEMTAQKE